jgi:hypothetical protein
MPESELKDTQPTENQPNTPRNSSLPVKERDFPHWLVGVFVVLILAIGLLAGYNSGMSQRYAAQNTVAVGQLDQQFQLGTRAVAAGNYELARQYF